MQKRLQLNYTDYTLHPIQTIKSLLGHNIKILKHTPIDMLLSNDLIPVDITYTVNKLIDSWNIYYINPETLKPISINSQKYIGELHINTQENTQENLSIKFIINLQELPKKTFPVRIFESLKSSVGYFANICDNPFTSVVTALKIPGVMCVGNINKSVTNVTSKDTYIASKEHLNDNINIYTTGVKLFNALSMIDNIIPINNITEDIIIKYSTTAYILSFNKIYEFLLNQLTIRGIIFIYSDRTHPDVCLWYPTVSYSINPQELHSLKYFVDKETNDYIQFNEHL